MYELYTKIINGTRIIKSSNEITINTQGSRTIYNPSRQLLLDDGWVPYVIEPSLVSIETDDVDSKDSLKDKINKHYESNRVKIFYQFRVYLSI